MSPSRTAAVLVACALAFAAAPAFAQDDDYLKKEAQQRFQEGVTLLSAGQNEQARAKFLQAYATTKRPNVVFNLARSEHLTGRHLEATRHYREYLRIADPKKVSQKERDDIDGWLRETVKQIGRIEVAAPAGSHVSVDGERVGDAPLLEPIDVAKGKHVVIAEVKGKRITTDADAPAGSIVKVALVEESPPAPPVAPVGPDPRPSSDVVEPPPPAGEPSMATRNITVGALAGLSVVGLGVGLYFTVKSNQQVADARDYSGHIPGGACATKSSGTCAQYDSMLGDASSSRGAAVGAYIAGGVLAVAAGATFLLWPSSKRSQGSVRPFVTTSSLGVAGTF